MLKDFCQDGLFLALGIIDQLNYGGSRMKAKFDLFLRLPDGQPVWIKAVETLEDAQTELSHIAAHSPGDYFIFNAKNGRLILPSPVGQTVFAHASGHGD
jgi:hypothetical protein